MKKVWLLHVLGADDNARLSYTPFPPFFLREIVIYLHWCHITSFLWSHKTDEIITRWKRLCGIFQVFERELAVKTKFNWTTSCVTLISMISDGSFRYFNRIIISQRWSSPMIVLGSSVGTCATAVRLFHHSPHQSVIYTWISHYCPDVSPTDMFH